MRVCARVRQELNVRVLTTTSDKRRYGVRLRAEPDHRVLGARLKGAFKGVVAAIRQLTDDQLAGFQQTGALTVEGHALAPDDLRLMYVFDGAADGAPSRYEAYSENEVGGGGGKEAGRGGLGRGREGWWRGQGWWEGAGWRGAVEEARGACSESDSKMSTCESENQVHTLRMSGVLPRMLSSYVDCDSDPRVAGRHPGPADG